MSTYSDEDKSTAAIPFVLSELDFYYPEDNKMVLSRDPAKKINVTSDQPIVLQFWASWCRPCHMVTPFLNRYAELYKDVIFLAMNKEGQAIQDNDLGFRYPVVHDTLNSTITKYMTKFNVRGVPHVFLIHQGEVVYHGHPLEDGFEAALMQVSKYRRDDRYALPASWKLLAPEPAGQTMPDLTTGKHVLHVIDAIETDEEAAALQNCIDKFPSDFNHYIVSVGEPSPFASKFPKLPQLLLEDLDFLEELYGLMGLPLEQILYSFAIQDGQVIEGGEPALVHFVVTKNRQSTTLNK